MGYTVHRVAKSQTQLSTRSNIPLSVYTTSSFSHSSVGGHQDCFHNLAIVNNAAMSTRVHVSFGISMFGILDRYPGVELLGHMLVLLLVFCLLRTSILFSTVAVTIYLFFN